MSYTELPKAIWWWHCSCKEGWTPDSRNRVSWWVRMTSMQDLESPIVWAGSEISWCNPRSDVNGSRILPTSFHYQYHFPTTEKVYIWDHQWVLKIMGFWQTSWISWIQSYSLNPQIDFLLGRSLSQKDRHHLTLRFGDDCFT